MKTTIDILLIILSLIVLVQDIRERMITVGILVIMCLLLIAEFVFYNSSLENCFILISNGLFISSQLVFLYLYMTFVRKNKNHFFTALIGWGDIIMMYIMALVFPLPQLIVYLISAFLLGILFGVFSGTNKTSFSIPLAGLMALLFAFNLLVYYATGSSLITPFSYA